VGHAEAARLHNGEFGSPATAKRHWSTARGVATTCWAYTGKPGGYYTPYKTKHDTFSVRYDLRPKGSVARKSPHKAFLLLKHQVPRHLTCEFWGDHRGDARDVKRCRLLHSR
jgi:hypothetical protein